MTIPSPAPDPIAHKNRPFDAGSVWVVIPTYNEKLNIVRLIAEIFSLPLPHLSLLVVDDNSPDGTGALVTQLQSQYPKLFLLSRPKKNGLGRAYVDGFDYAIKQGANTIVQMDADFSHNPADIPRLLQALTDQDVVIGSRYAHGISVINWPLHRLLLSTSANIYAGFVTGMPFKDCTGGFRAWRASTLTAINFSDIQVDGYGFQIIMLYRTWRQPSRIIEVPIIFTERREGQSKMTNSIIAEAMILVWKLRLFG
ncbi:MAG TPA: dolichyl-phosphate beta-D-mannosyltransferase [Candidatus Andersenbacteria bacterium]|nr:MAG: Glycosyl transferase family 2 [Parcubacteria group bacterium GW2011_GWA2_45_14]HBE89835.1 dolichyl-phosphate beta-D-mannosyltransferase [Candidatus Andersenbacteria bacterium]